MLLLLPSAFLTSLGIGVINLGMLFVVKDEYRASPSAVGWFAALWAITYFVGCIALRPLHQRIGARLSMAAMNLGTALLLLAHLFTRNLASAFAVYGLYGFITALFWPRLMGWLSSGLEGQALSKATSAFSFSWSSGGIVAPYLAGLLAEKGRFLPVYVSIGVFAATGLFIALSSRLVATPPFAPTPLAPAAKGADGQPGAEAEGGARAEAANAADRSTPLRFPAWIGVFLLYALLSVFFNIFPLFAKDELGLSESRIGLILLIRAVSTTAGFWILGRVETWHFKKAYIVAPIAIALLIDLAFIGVRSPLLFGVLLAVAGFFHAMAYNNSIFYGVSGALDRDKRMTIHEALLTAGQILGSLAGGMLYQRFSWGSIFLFLAFVFVAGMAGQLRYLRRRS